MIIIGNNVRTQSEIKLLAIGKCNADSIEVRVHPTMIPLDHPLANIKGVNNAIYVKGDFVGETMFYGPGAGSLPTASSVVADIMDITHNIDAPPNQRNLMADYENKAISSIGETESEYFIRRFIKFME